jgi:aspartate/methionine/tyrosine aminotransferase
VGGGGVTKLRLRDVATEIDYEQPMSYGVMTKGSEEIRRAIASWFRQVEQDNVLVTTGTSEANLLGHLRILEPGDEYVAEKPSYQQTIGLAKSLGCRVKEFCLDEKEGWKLDLAQLNEIVTKRTRVIFVDNPNNPTGSILTEKEMKSICEIAKDVDAYVFCDNALRGSELDGRPAATPFEYYEKGVVTGSISKLGATDPRLGWLIGNKDLVDACWVLKDYTTLSHSRMGESLAMEVLRPERRSRIIERNLGISRANLIALSEWIERNSNVMSCVPPRGGFTAFPKYALPIDSVTFCNRFLEEKKVLLSPGEFFGVDRHFRINVGCESEIMREALRRLESFLERV